MDEAIRQPAIDYVESWVDGDARRMAACLHPDLVKRAVLANDEAAIPLDRTRSGR